jgi:hypothetical protein
MTLTPHQQTRFDDMVRLCNGDELAVVRRLVADPNDDDNRELLACMIASATSLGRGGGYLEEALIATTPKDDLPTLQWLLSQAAPTAENLRKALEFAAYNDACVVLGFLMDMLMPDAESAGRALLHACGHMRLGVIDVILGREPEISAWHLGHCVRVVGRAARAESIETIGKLIAWRPQLWPAARARLYPVIMVAADHSSDEELKAYLVEICGR